MKIVFFALWFISLITWCIFAIRNETNKMHIALIVMLIFNVLLCIFK